MRGSNEYNFEASTTSVISTKCLFLHSTMDIFIYSLWDAQNNDIFHLLFLKLGLRPLFLEHGSNRILEDKFIRDKS